MMKIRLRTLMKIVAFLAVLAGISIHIKRIVEREEDFAVSILLFEGEVLAVLLGVALGIRYFTNLARKDRDYAAHLWQTDAPFPSFDPAGEPNSSDPERGKQG